jgi:hypothetical protein
MAFGNSNDIEIQVRLEAEKTRQQLAELTKSVDKLSGSLSGASKATNKAEADLDSFSKNAAKAGTAAILGLAGAFVTFRKVVDIGDKLGDIRNGFEETARSAGVLSDKLLKDLNAASKNAVTNLSLMSQATKALELGIAADQIDDLAFAAQRYADNHGKDFVDSFEDRSPIYSRPLRHRQRWLSRHRQIHRSSSGLVRSDKERLGCARRDGEELRRCSPRSRRVH